jgi:hypothetical protein
VPELRGDERVQLRRPRAGIEIGLALFVFLAPDDMAGTGPGWYVSDARRLERLCALRRCGHPVRLNQYGPEVDLVPLGP